MALELLGCDRLLLALPTITFASVGFSSDLSGNEENEGVPRFSGAPHSEIGCQFPAPQTLGRKPGWDEGKGSKEPLPSEGFLLVCSCKWEGDEL